MKKKITSILVILLSCFTLTSCSSFVGDGQNEVTIASIETVTLSDGNIKMIITYTDVDRSPDEFILPKGTDGNGIKTILSTTTDDGKTNILKIFFTDEEMEPIEFRVNNGTSVSGVESVVNEETGDVSLIVKYNDGTTSEPILLPRGKDGEDGNSFTGYEIVENEDKSLTINFHFNKTEDVVITIPAPQKGDKGNGIRSIIASETNTEYILTINYDNDTSEEVSFTKPKTPNTWLNGSSVPTSSLGNNGDYYFDIYHNNIYIKENGAWSLLIEFDSSEETYTIQFNLNDSDDAPAKLPSGTYKKYYIKRGTYFQSIENNYGGTQIPIPSREGYKFVGWYRVPEPTVINSPFTDLTPVFSDLILYAVWELE